MPVDITLVKATLAVLERHRGRKPDPTEEVVALDLETLLRRPLATHQVTAAVTACRQQGWAVDGTDEWGQPTWAITPAGTVRSQQP